ncbi:MAG: EAL domain-containing protein [Gammaproteobacteria bacterium]|nr:EAL domain-containing protein [Gammaproteobacteria bacterium]
MTPGGVNDRMKRVLAASTLLIVTLLALVYVQVTDRQDRAIETRFMENVNLVKRLNEAIAYDVMALDTGEQLNYDRLSHDQSELFRISSTMRRDIFAVLSENGSTDIKSQLALIHQSEIRLESVLEDYKTQHAILRNSQRFLSSRAARNALTTGEIGEIDNEWYMLVSDFINDLFAYNFNLSPSIREHMLNEIHIWRDKFLPDVSRYGDRLELLRHLELVIEDLPVVKDLRNEILQLTQFPYEHLERLYLKQRESVMQHWEVMSQVFFWLTLFFAVCVLLALYLLYRNMHRLTGVLSELRNQKFALDQHSIVSIADLEGNITYANDRFVEGSGYSREELLNANHNLLNSGMHSKEYFSNLWNTVLAGKVWQGEICNRSKQGELFWCNSTIVPFLDDKGKPYQFIAIRTDITARKTIEENLIQAKERAQVILDSVGDAVISIDRDLNIDYMNPVAERLAGLELEDAQARGNLLALFDIIDERERKPESYRISNCIEKGHREILSTHMLLNRLDGREFSVEIIIAPTHDSQHAITGAVLAMHDMTEIRGMARKISHQANHDALTGLSNRNEFERILRALLHKSVEEGVDHVLCFIDLDHFKVVNDTCGHVSGDELLRQLAEILRSQIRDRDLLARIGGDEFAVLLGECPMERAEEIAKNICRRVKEFRFAWEDKVFQIGASIGLAAINADSVDAVTVMRHADTACYMAKDKGRNGYYIYRENDEELSQRSGEMQWITRLTRALDENLFELHVQKAISLTGNPDYYEVLIRMRQEDGELVSPMAFIPAAERHGLMQDIDRWVINQVLKNNVHWQREKCVVSINVSGASLSDPNLADFVICALRQYQVSAHQICFEITETAAIANLGNAVTFINKLKDAGCLFALDDFGSGLSSFGYLKQLPVDFLKIDGVFVRDMVEDEIDSAMVESINHIGHVMGLKTIAEFVESEMILEKVREIGVDYAQGYGVAEIKPLLPEGSVPNPKRLLI